MLIYQILIKEQKLVSTIPNTVGLQATVFLITLLTQHLGKGDRNQEMISGKKTQSEAIETAGQHTIEAPRCSYHLDTIDFRHHHGCKSSITIRASCSFGGAAVVLFSKKSVRHEYYKGSAQVDT